MKHHIPIVAISDNKLTFTVGTLFVNLLDTKHKDTFYDFFAVMAPDVSRENINKIKQIEKTYKNDCSITIIKMDNRFDNISNNTGYIANACAYKMCLAEILPKLDKVIYLDTDIIVFDDLSEFYNTDIKNAYIGGVHSISHYLYRRELIEKLQIPDLAYYINAGVMLMNLKQIRQNRIQTKLTQLIGTYNDSVDQHIFNRVCYGHIKLLSPLYNIMRTTDLSCSERHQLIGVNPYEYKLMQEHPVIYHYTGREKPWNCFDLKYALIWLRYYKKSPFGKDRLFLESCHEMNQD
ncbi:MAG: glycosyltransferase family 8 protein, partial [Alphaproteobacteria bacterium]|nr:glycosyltransferase family 8 protein [Alphaproteobacteria bacterium]